MSKDDGYQAWLDDALCRDPMYDPEWWFADISKPADRMTAKKVCNQCTVQHICLKASEGNTEGIWAGLDSVQRRNLRREV